MSADKVKRANTLQCESCGKTAPRLYGNYGKQVCSPCQAMRGIAKANPAAVILSLREFGHQLGEQTAPDDHAHNAMAADLEGARERIAVLEQQIAAKEKDLEEAKNSTFSAELTDTTDRRAVHDLALRLSIGLLRGKALNITVDDIEMLRTI